MASPADRIFREVLALSAKERANLFRRLREALSEDHVEAPHEVQAAWVDLALARLARHERGEAGPTKSIDEVEGLLTASLREP